MKHSARTRLVSAICVLSAAFAAAPASAAVPTRVMIVHSYSATHVCGAPQAAGVMEALSERGWIEGRNLEVQSYHMDTKKRHTTAEAIREQARIALERVESFKPSVVVVLDVPSRYACALLGRESP